MRNAKIKKGLLLFFKSHGVEATGSICRLSKNGKTIGTYFLRGKGQNKKYFENKGKMLYHIYKRCCEFCELKIYVAMTFRNINQREREFVESRQIFFFVVRSIFGRQITWLEMGKFLGKSHSSAILGAKAVRDRFDVYKEESVKIGNLIERIKKQIVYFPEEQERS